MQGIVFWDNFDGRWQGIYLTEEKPTLEWEFYHDTEEGHRHGYITWRLNLDTSSVEKEEYSYERDCDGPLERWDRFSCLIGDLEYHDHMIWTDGPNPKAVVSGLFKIPNWQRAECEQRDHYAEQMGY